MPRVAPRWVRLQSDPVLGEFQSYADRLKAVAKDRNYPKYHPVSITAKTLSDYVKRALTEPRRL